MRPEDQLPPPGLEARMTDELPLSQAELKAFRDAHDGLSPIEYLEMLNPGLRDSIARLNKA